MVTLLKRKFIAGILKLLHYVQCNGIFIRETCDALIINCFVVTVTTYLVTLMSRCNGILILYKRIVVTVILFAK